MKITTTFSVVSLVVFGVQFASAADLGKPAAKHGSGSSVLVSSKVLNPADFNWGGFYIGAQGGYALRKSQNVKFNPIGEVVTPELKKPVDTANIGNFDSGRLLGGAFVGYNIGVGNGAYFGVETDLTLGSTNEQKYKLLSYQTKAPLSLSSPSAAQSYALKLGLSQESAAQFAAQLAAHPEASVTANFGRGMAFSSHWSGATRLRLGFGAERYFPYVAAGLAYHRASLTPQTTKTTLAIRTENGFTGHGSVAAHAAVQTQTFLGYSLGTGLDIAMSRAALLRFEYRYNYFGDKVYNITDVTAVAAKFNLGSQEMRLGFGVKF